MSSFVRHIDRARNAVVSVSGRSDAAMEIVITTKSVETRTMAGPASATGSTLVYLDLAGVEQLKFSLWNREPRPDSLEVPPDARLATALLLLPGIDVMMSCQGAGVETYTWHANT